MAHKLRFYKIVRSKKNKITESNHDRIREKTFNS
jgi:hypothetical protein